jgi:hypothetical protein
MTADERVKAVVDFGFTERQARFLVTVMLHSGVCLLRQYTAFAGIVHGQKTRKFFHKLVSRRYATAYPCRHNRGRVYHVHHKALYRAIGETDSRYRRPLSASRIVDGLMLLDAVLARPDLVWLATDDEKRVHLAELTATAANVPDTTLGNASSPVVHRWPERVPIGVDPSGRWVFIHLVSETGVDAFRRFLQRHGELFAALSEWTLRIVLPPHLDSLAGPCQDLVRQELASPLRDDVLSELKRYFKQRRANAIQCSMIQDDESYHEARFAFGAPRFEVLYRRWLSEGDMALNIVSSRVIAEAIGCGSGRVECHVLPFSYRHLSPLVASSGRAPQGAEKGDDAPSQPRPPLAFPAPVAEAGAESARHTSAR